VRTFLTCFSRPALPLGGGGPGEVVLGGVQGVVEAAGGGDRGDGGEHGGRVALLTPGGGIGCLPVNGLIALP